MSDELDVEILKSTQQILGKYVTKPPLTDKLLRKPPFRFLHDVINTVIKETGFLKGLFSEGDLLSDNVKDKDSKVAFLNKLITAIKSITGADLPVHASKIIAGLEPAETNKLLQAIGNAIDEKLDSKEYIKSLKDGKKSTKTKTKSKEPDKTKKTSKSSVNSETKDLNRVKKSVDTPKNDKIKSKTKEISPKDLKTKTSGKSSVKDDKLIKVKRESSKTSKDSPKTSKDSPKLPKDSQKILKDSPKEKLLKESPRVSKSTTKERRSSIKQDSPKEITSPKTPKSIIEDKPIIEIKDIIQDPVEEMVAAPEKLEINGNDPIEIIKEVEPPRKMERPKSARPRSGDLKKEIQPISEIEKPPIEIKAPEIIKKPPEAPFRPKSSLLRPPSVRPSSARPGAPRLRPESALPLKEMVTLGKINVIVENFSNDDAIKDDDEETVVIQNIPDEIQEPVSIEQLLDLPAEKGHLVEQILEQIQGDQLDEHVKGSNIDWEQEGLRGRDATTKEINTLRASIQSLTKTANPLGKLMSYLHEDVEAMHSELDSWSNMKRQYTTEITKQKRLNNDSSLPLKNQLDEFEESIKKQREQIGNVKFNILRNDLRIKDLIDKQITVQ